MLDTIAGWTDSQPQANGTDSSLAPRQSAREVDRLIDHLERAVRSSAYMHALEDRTQVLNAMYNQMPWPMLMLDDSMQVLECNPVARQVLADGPVQLREDGSLLFADRALKLALDRINRLAEGREPRLISSPGDGVSLLCLPVQKSDAPGTLSQLRTIVWVLAGHSVVTPSPEMLRSLFNITQAESRLLHLLCKIGNLNQSARLLNVSVHTARTQLKSTMAKLKANSQVQLVSHAMGHALVQAAKLPQLHMQREYTLSLPDRRVLSWYEYGDPDGRPVLTLDNLGASLPDHSYFEEWYREKGLRMIMIVRPGYGISTYKSDLEFRSFAPDIMALCGHLELDRPPMAAYCGEGLMRCALPPCIRISSTGSVCLPAPFPLNTLNWTSLIHSTICSCVCSGEIRACSCWSGVWAFVEYRRHQRNFCHDCQGIVRSGQSRAGKPGPATTNHYMYAPQPFPGARIMIDEYLRMQHPWQVDLSKITMPVMQWHGEDDRIISIGSARGLANELPGVRFRSFPGLGRFMVYPMWKEFLTELLELA